MAMSETIIGYPVDYGQERHDAMVEGLSDILDERRWNAALQNSPPRSVRTR